MMKVESPDPFSIRADYDTVGDRATIEEARIDSVPFLVSQIYWRHRQRLQLFLSEIRIRIIPNMRTKRKAQVLKVALARSQKCALWKGNVSRYGRRQGVIPSMLTYNPIW